MLIFLFLSYAFLREKINVRKNKRWFVFSFLTMQTTDRLEGCLHPRSHTCIIILGIVAHGLPPPPAYNKLAMRVPCYCWENAFFIAHCPRSVAQSWAQGATLARTKKTAAMLLCIACTSRATPEECIVNREKKSTLFFFSLFNYAFLREKKSTFIFSLF